MNWGNGKGWKCNDKSNWNLNQAPYGGGRKGSWQRTSYLHGRVNQFGSTGMARSSSDEEPSVAPMVSFPSHNRPCIIQVTLPAEGKGTQIDWDRHDALVTILSLNPTNVHVRKAKPKDDESISWPCWIRRVLPSKPFHTWLDTLRWLGFLEDELDKLEEREDLDDLFDLLVQCEVSTIPIDLWSTDEHVNADAAPTSHQRTPTEGN